MVSISQVINTVDSNSNSYDTDITVSGIPSGYFPAVTDIYPPNDGSDIRKVTVNLMAVDWAPGGSQTVTTNLYVRIEGETAIETSVVKDGNVEATNTVSYS